MRHNNRQPNELRPIELIRNYTKHAEGSVLSCFGETKVLCNVSIIDGVPRFLKGKGQGWLTAEYGMLPRSTHDRMDREAARGKQSGRTLEIQRLIGRALRSALDLTMIGECTITIDCDVIQADGGTRTAAITGACVALVDAIRVAIERRLFTKNPFRQMLAAVSVGICDGVPMLDLDYNEDSAAETDMNIIMTEHGKFIELQGTAEKNAFSHEELLSLLALGESGIRELFEIQKAVLFPERVGG